MAKQRVVIGSILKSEKPGESDYFKLRGAKFVKDTLTRLLSKADEKKGLNFKLENKKNRLDSLEDAVKAGKLTGDLGDKIRADIEKMPDYVRFEVVVYVDKQAA